MAQNTIIDTGIISPLYPTFKVRQGFDSRYVGMLLLAPMVVERYDGIAFGSVPRRRRTSVGDFLNLQIPSPPPIEEQRRIAAILDHASGMLRTGQAIIAQLGRLRTAMFSHHFGAPPTWTERWSMGSVGDITAEARYGTSAKASAAGTYAVLRMGNLTYDGQLDLGDLKYMELGDDEVARYTVRRGDILFNRTNSADLVGKTAVVRTDKPLAYAGYLVRLRLTDGNQPEFVSGYLNSRHGKAVLRGMCKSIVGQANINAREMQSIRIPIPPATAQLAYSEDVATVDAQVEVAVRRQAELGCVFESLQARAFSGRL